MRSTTLKWQVAARYAGIAALITGCPLKLTAADIRWAAPGGGIFNDGLNWNGGVAPGAVDKAIFDAAGAYTVTWGASSTNANASVNKTGSAVTFVPGAHTWRVTNNFWVAENSSGAGSVMTLDGGRLAVAKAMDVGNSRKGTLIVTNGASLEIGGNLKAGNNTLDASLIVAGSGSQLTVGGTIETMMLACSSNLVMVADGGRLLLPGSSSYMLSYQHPQAQGNRIVVDGPGSLLEVGGPFLYFRNNGTRFTVSNGGRVTVKGVSGFAITPDNNYGSRSNLFEIVGAGSRMDVNAAFLFGTYNSVAKRLDNDNRFRVADGAQFNVGGNLNIGGTNNQLMAEGANTVLYSKELNVRPELGTVDPVVLVRGGAMLTNQVLSLQSGDMIVTGTGSRYHKGIGGAAVAGMPSLPPARLIVSDGGTVQVPNANHFSIGGGSPEAAEAGAAGMVEVRNPGSRFEMTGPNERILFVGEWGSGRLAVRDGGAVATTMLALGLQIPSTNSVLEIDGVAARVMVENDCNLTRGTLRFTADGAGFGRLEVGQKLTINSGTKLVIDADRLSAGEGQFVLATFASRSGTFGEDQIEIINGLGRVTQTATTLSVCIYPQGTTFLVR